MTETRVFSRRSDIESERTPAGGQTPRTSDTLVGAPGSPDPDHHPEALANAVTDSEAGAIPDNDEGGITPLKRRE